jgi:hypothetical protein
MKCNFNNEFNIVFRFIFPPLNGTLYNFIENDNTNFYFDLMEMLNYRKLIKLIDYRKIEASI